MDTLLVMLKGQYYNISYFKKKVCKYHHTCDDCEKRCSIRNCIKDTEINAQMEHTVTIFKVHAAFKHFESRDDDGLCLLFC